MKLMQHSSRTILLLLLMLKNHLHLRTICFTCYKPCLHVYHVQPSGTEKAIKVKQKILSFRGKEYLLQNSIVDLECNECGRLFRCPGVYRQRIYKDGTSKDVGKHNTGMALSRSPQRYSKRT